MVTAIPYLRRNMINSIHKSIQLPGKYRIITFCHLPVTSKLPHHSKKTLTSTLFINVPYLFSTCFNFVSLVHTNDLHIILAYYCEFVEKVNFFGCLNQILSVLFETFRL